MKFPTPKVPGNWPAIRLFVSILQVGVNELLLFWLEVVMTVLLVLMLLYTVLGGMLSVLVTDYLQFLVVGVGIVITSVLVLMNIGWGNLVHSLQSAWAANAAAGVQTAHPFNPAHSSSDWGYLAWQLVFQLAVVTTWQTTITRVLAMKDASSAKQVYRRASEVSDECSE